MQSSLTYRTNRDLFSNYYLDEHLPETEEWDEVDDEELEAAYDEIVDLYEREKSTAPKRNESQLEEKFIRPMFRKLGIPFEVEESTSRTQRRPDYGFFETEDAARDAFERREGGGDFYENAVAVADAKRWGRPLDTRGSGEHERDFENPSYQIHVYLQETPARWAVLTDGKKWRLYYGPTSHRLDSYYEVDLPTVLEKGDLEDFKYFYLFFRHGAFLEDTSGDCFLDDVYDESNVFAQDLGEDLQDNIYEAIKILSEGYLQYPDNDLDENDLDLVHDSSLIYLYRLIFVLYAEAEGRDLLDTDNEIYEQSYSLNSLKQEVAEELDSGDPKYRDWQDDLSSRLDELFELIDQGSKSRGIPEDDLYIPAYNGGLFRTNPDEDDDPEARFLAEHTVGDAYLARVVELLTRSRQANGGGKIFVDYSSLDVRHLGSIYEGLLEYQIYVADGPLALDDDDEYVEAEANDDVAVEEGEVYLTTGSGERKATGSYYTPEYVVEYIVDETLGPLVEDIREDLLGYDSYSEGGFAAEFAERVFELKILDPAMGSGHFLTSAVDYLAREIIDAQEKQAAQQGIETVEKDHDINWARRKVAQRCIYGVDLNPLATELAKVSLWLRTLAAEQPLAFLDHHLKSGNSLVGSDIDDVLADGEEAEGEAETEDRTADGQVTFTQFFEHARQEALEHVMDRFADLLSIDNETLEDAKEMEDVYDEVREDPLYQHLLAMANVHTADQFGLDVPGDAYERMARALQQSAWDSIEEQDWFKSAQAMADDERFFHWELEFPVAFYDANGDRMADAGFDAVIGNPPYISAWNRDLGQDSFFRSEYFSASGHYDIYGLFIEKGVNLLRQTGKTSMIIPDTFCGQAYAENCRELLTTKLSLKKVLDLRDRVVFDDAQVDNIIFVAEEDPTHAGTVSIEKIRSGTKADIMSSHTFPYSLLSKEYEYRIPLSEQGLNISIREKITSGLELEDAFYISKGMEPHTAEGGSKYDFIKKENPDEGMKPYIEGKHIGRWRIHSNWFINYSPDQHKAPAFRELFESRKVVGARTIGEGRPMFAVDEQGYYNNEKTLNAVPYDELQDVSVSQVSVSEQKLQYGEKFSLYAVMAVLNSAMTSFTFREIESGALDFFPRHLKKVRLPVPNEIPDYGSKSPKPESFDGGERSRSEMYAALDLYGEQMAELKTRRSGLNTSLLDYLGNYEKGPELPDIGLFQPAASGILDATTAEYEKLRVGDVRADREGTTVTVSATARYKPDDEDAHETDTYGYTETEYLEAFTLLNLSEKEAALVAAFVLVAVDEELGGFIDEARKSISVLDRLKAITLPDPEDVAADLDRYVETKERADELDAKIDQTDHLIDEIVYDLYDLTDEEIEIVESTVADD